MNTDREDAPQRDAGTIKKKLFRNVKQPNHTKKYKITSRNC